MAATKDIKDFTKYPSLSDNDYLLGTKTDLGGTDAGITVSDFRKQVVQDVKPEIKDGYWWLNGANTGVKAEGQVPVFRYTGWGIEYKLEGQDDAAFQKLIPFSDIAFTWNDLTEEQKAGLKGKTPVLESVAATSGETPSGSFSQNGTDEQGNPRYSLNLTLPKGENGQPPLFEPGTEASAEVIANGFTPEGNPKYLLNFTVPRGMKGSDGTGTGNVSVVTTGLVSGTSYLFVPDANDSPSGTFVEYTAPTPDTSELVKINRAAIADQLINEIGYGYQENGWKNNGPILQFGTAGYFKQIQGNAGTDKLFYRSVGSGVFNDWKEFAFKDNLSDYIQDAPIDGKQYMRKDGNWVEKEARGEYTTATTVANLDVNYKKIFVTLSADASLSANLTGGNYNGRSVTAYVYCPSARTITIPTTGSYVSMCGNSYTCPAGKWVEFNLECIAGIWHIAKLEQE